MRTHTHLSTSDCGLGHRMVNDNLACMTTTSIDRRGAGFHCSSTSSHPTLVSGGDQEVPWKTTRKHSLQKIKSCWDGRPESNTVPMTRLLYQGSHLLDQPSMVGNSAVIGRDCWENKTSQLPRPHPESRSLLRSRCKRDGWPRSSYCSQKGQKGRVLSAA